MKLLVQIDRELYERKNNLKPRVQNMIFLILNVNLQAFMATNLFLSGNTNLLIYLHIKVS